MPAFLGPIGDLYEREVLDRGEQEVFFLLAAFLASFLAIRTSARLMRSPKVPWWPGSVKYGGLHVHHFVFGIVVMLIAGFLAFAVDPHSAWLDLLAVAFGIGAGLTLDEFALWLHLEDVYWAEEGRKSLDAVVVATLFMGLVFLGVPIADIGQGGLVVVTLGLLLTLAFAAICLLKGKLWVGVLGLFVFPVGVTGAIRLAKPGSPWAHRFYARNERKLARARARHRERRWFHDVVMGRPDPRR